MLQNLFRHEGKAEEMQQDSFSSQEDRMMIDLVQRNQKLKIDGAFSKFYKFERLEMPFLLSYLSD